LLTRFLTQELTTVSFLVCVNRFDPTFLLRFHLVWRGDYDLCGTRSRRSSINCVLF
jgi:hypothetical protein